MDFQFFSEMPMLSVRSLKCPYIYHKKEWGDIDSSKPEYMYDSVAEMMPIKYLKRMSFGYNLGKGKVPALCRKDFKIFMWDTETNQTYAPTNQEELKFCVIFLKALKSEKSVKDRNKDFANDIPKISILKQKEEKK